MTALGIDDPVMVIISPAGFALLPFPDLALVSAATQQALQETLQHIDPEAAVPADAIQVAARDGSGLTGAARLVLATLGQRGLIDPNGWISTEVRTHLLTAYAEVGIMPPSTVTPTTMILVLDMVRTTLAQEDAAHAHAQALAYGVVAALAYHDLFIAEIIAQGLSPDWEYARRVLLEQRELESTQE
ncbi:MAG: hypothetical protein EI684_02785 [Candidatus Viridilinea halotolerans]|uniref:Uncharacterized protein n=1 Tax=Candidatus Viridilinea halotolerans TaxID=2491704 RepID=A0A426U8Q2_9CHLR|nr:MAG: hypothetical protein EI684_02785 [Candidatus Viridilinea halotolerans]